MSTYKHLADLLKICSVLPALAIMPAMAENAQYSNPTDVESWIENTYDVDDDTSRNGGVLKVESGKEIDAINAGTVSGNTVNLIKTESSSGEIYGQGSVLYNNGSIGAITGTFENNSVVNTSDTVNKGKATVNGGAFALYGGTNIGSITGDFTGNSAIAKYAGEGETSYTSDDQISAGGGAMHIQGAFGEGPVTIGRIEGNFTGNSAHGDGYANGGALYIKAGANDREGVDKYGVQIDEIVGNFDGNFAVATTGTNDNKKDSTGGAISIKEDGEYSVVANINGNFTNNYVSTNSTNALGGAIYNAGTLTVNGDFIANKAISESGKAYGGAIYNTGDLTVSGLFSDNTAVLDGGAIVNDVDANLTVKNASFVENKSTGYGYGGAIGSKGQMSITDSSFVNNSTEFVGGALYSGYNDNGTGKGAAVISGTLFSGNEAVYGAGAIANYANMEINISQSIFDGNKVTGALVDDGYDNHNLRTSIDGGGALFVGSASKTDVENALFKNNSSTVTGGAISTRADWYSASTDKTINDKGSAPEGYDTSTDYLKPNTKAELNLKRVEFAGNAAGTYGGAIYNTFEKTSIADAVFIGNTAGVSGGAIYNESVAKMEFAGNNVFAGNTAAGVANDIHNDGIIDVASGTTIIGSGISGTGSLNIAEGATLNIGTTTVKQSEVTLEGTLTAQILNQGSYGRVETGNITVGDNGLLNLMFGSVGTYNFGVTVPEDKIVYNNAIYDATFCETGEITVATKSVEEIAQGTNLSMGAANAVSIMANTNDDVLNTISLMAQQDLVAGKTGNAEKELAKLNPDDKPVAQSVASSVQNQVMSLAAGRMSGASVGRSGGDLTSADYGLWVQGLYNHSKYNGKFSGDTWGISVGADTLIDGKYTLGIGYAYNDTDVDSNSRDTGIESNSLFLYGQYKPNEWYVNAALNYTMANYDESADPYGFKRKTEYDVDSFGGQIMTGYDFASGFTPEVGMRYLHISQDAYQSWLGEVDALDTDYLTGVAGVKYAFEIETDSELSLRPELRAAATYDFMSDAAVATVTAPGNVAYVIDADRLSRLGGEFGIGLVGNYKGVEVSLNYDLDLHEDYTSHTGMLKFRYNF